MLGLLICGFRVDSLCDGDFRARGHQKSISPTLATAFLNAVLMVVTRLVLIRKDCFGLDQAYAIIGGFQCKGIR